MPFTFHCPGCNEPLQLPETAVGRTIRCRHCTETFRVPEPGRDRRPDADEPPPRRRAESAAERTPRRRPRPIPAAWFGIGIAGMVVLAGVGATGVHYATKPEQPAGVAGLPNFNPNTQARPQPDRAAPQPPAEWRPPQTNAGDPNAAGNPGAQAGPRPGTGSGMPTPQPRPGQPPMPQPGQRPVPADYPRPWRAKLDGPPDPPFVVSPMVHSPAASIQIDEDSPWDVTPDPSPELVELPGNYRLSVPLPAGSEGVQYPTTPSRFALLGDNSSDRSIRISYDLIAKKAFGRITGRFDPHEAVQSPDGKLLALRSRNDVAVWSFETGKPVALIKGESSVDWLDFGPGEDELLLVRREELHRIRYSPGEQTAEPVDSRSIPREAILAPSPGRKYLAVASDRELQVIRVEDFQVAGRRDLPDLKQFDPRKVRGVAFSADGSEIVVARDVHFQDARRVTSWDVATGRVTAAHVLMSLPEQMASRYQGPAIEYMSGQREWLWWGRYVVEHDSGAILTDLGFPQQPFRPAQRRVLPGDVVLTLGGVGGREVLVGTPINRERLDAARQEARRMLARPEAAAPESEGATAVSVSADPAWAVTPERVETPRLRAAPMAVRARDVLSVHFAGPASGLAATLARTSMTAPFGAEIIELDLYDLKAGKRIGGAPVGLPLGRVDRDAWKPLGDLSPEGRSFALRDPVDPRRVDVWSVGDKVDHQAGLLASEHPLIWLGTGWGGRLLTIDAAGVLTCRELPDAKALYRIEGGYRAAALDPARRWLAAFRDDGWDLIDVEDGRQSGRLVTGPAGNFGQAGGSHVVASFSPDGGRLAAVVSGGQWGQTVWAWDLADGKQLHRFDTRPLGRELHWAGDQFLLQDSHLVDLKGERLFWGFSAGDNYNLVRATATPDGNHWYVVDRKNAQPGDELGFADLTRLVVRDGEPVRAVRFEVNVPHAESEAVARKLLGEQLEAYGIAIDASAPVTLQVAATLGTQQFQGPQGATSAPKVDGTIRLIGPDGRTFWETTAGGATGPILSERVGGVVNQDETVWELFRHSVANRTLPREIVLSDGRATALPGVSTLPER